MSRRRRAAFLALALAPASALFAAPVIVPPDAVIDDREARLAVARLDLQAGRAAAALAALEGWPAEDAEARDLLAEAYVRQGRFDDARRVLDERLAGAPAPAAALLLRAGEVRLYAGRLPEALPFFRRAHAADPALSSARRAYALALAWTGSGTEARPLLEALAREFPADAEVGRALAEVSAGDAGSSDRALALLRERVAREPADPAAKAALADLLASRGHAAEAMALYAAARDLQKPAPGDAFDLRHARARLTWGDFYPAEAAVRAALVKRPDDPELNALLISLLVSMDRLERATEDALRWLKTDPESAEAQTAFVEVWLKRNPAATADDARALFSARMTRARIAAEPPADALSTEFRAAGREGVRRDEFVRRHVGADEDAAPPFQAHELSRLAGLYAGIGDFDLAVRCFRAARRADEAYFPAWIGLAEFLAIAGRYDEAHREFEALALAFPGNRQVLLKQARALGWGRRYDESLAAYERLRALNPADPVPLLEQARVAGWAKDRERAARLYATRWEGVEVDARLLAGLRPLLAGYDGDDPTALAWRELATAEPPPAHEEPFHYFERFEAELADLLAAMPGKIGATVDLQLSLQADFQLQRAFWLENRAKQLAWDRRWWRSEETYARLLEVAPGNQEALFDLSQVQAAQGLGDREHATLGGLLDIDANNRLASHARFRRERRSEPLAFGQWDYYREKGRDQLSAIRRERLSLGGEATLDHRFRVRGALLRWTESPTDLAADLRARGFSVGVEGVFANWLAASADYTHKDNEGAGIGSVDTGGAQAWVPFRDALRVGAGVEVREELANSFAYFQGIRSTHRWIGAEAALSRRAEIAARAGRIDYADDNSGTHVWIAPAYSWTDHPRTFKTTLTLEARDTDEANIYQFAGPVLTDIVHPYWTPRDYRGAALTLEWRHDLARDFFIGAQEHWYDVRVTFGLSNDSNQGVSWAADYAREWRDRWVLRLGVGQTFSEQWDDLRAQARLMFRF